MEKAVTNIEIIVNVDENWPDPLAEDSRVTYIHPGSVRGMRWGINAAVSLAKGKYIMKSDDHCMFAAGFDKVLIFGRTKWGMEKLARALNERGVRASAIHGNKSQNQRQRALDDFKNDELQMLIATDVASRGLDIENVTHVINYDAPTSYDDYIHRIGRTGRAGKKGIALTFIE